MAGFQSGTETVRMITISFEYWTSLPFRKMLMSVGEFYEA